MCSCSSALSRFGDARLLLTASTVVALLVSAGCQKTTENKKADSGSVSDALTALAERQKLITDFEVKGVQRDLSSGQVLHFTYAVKQPGFMRAKVEESGTDFLFDGKALSITTPANKTVSRQEFGEKDTATMLVTVRNTFRAFVCEGWRPPLLSPRKVQGRTEYNKENDSAPPIWHLTMPVMGSSALKEVRYTLRAPGADFLEATKITPDGTVLEKTKVLEEYVHEPTRLAFPKKWQVQTGGEKYEVELTEIHVNEGLTADRFAATVPEGYAVKQVGRPAGGAATGKAGAAQ